MREPMRGVVTLCLAATLAACASARFPLCPKLAVVSYDSPRPGVTVNRYLAERAAERKVKISPLSAFAACYSGSARSLAWFKENYASMLCAFDPKQEIEDEGVYRACMANAPGWIKIVQSGKPEDLMLPETHYAGACVQ